MSGAAPTDEQRCEKLASAASRIGCRVGTAESLTGGAIAKAIAATAGASDWFSGAIVAYRPEVKFDLLDIEEGPVVTAAAAEQMARRAAQLLDTDVVVAVTGEAGPECQEPVPPGTVWVGVSRWGQISSKRHRFDGEPEEIVAAIVSQGLDALCEAVEAGRPRGS